jgi:4'-phosphopantetheinyl transferase
MKLIHWQPGKTTTDFSKENIHVYCLAIDEHLQHLERYQAHLNKAEQKNASRYHFEKDQQRSTISRGSLREILSAYLQQASKEIQFQLTEYDKPLLINNHPLQFNVTHSGNLVLIAVALDLLVGIDVEDTSREIEYQELAQRFFATNEAAAVAKLTGESLKQAFFNVWTRKEAFVKAIGEGLSYPLADFEVSTLPEERSTLLALKRQPEQAQQWQFISFQPRPGYQAALISRDIYY